MNKTVFIDGEAGTTGLKIASRLSARSDITLLKIDPARRKDVSARKKLINSAGIVFLCLPDDAAREALELVENPRTRVIDASTAHRISPGWAYGLPELSPFHREKIKNAARVAVPGCHATGFISLCYPLIKEGYLNSDYPFTCHSVTGYSGGGKSMIAEYEDKNRAACYASPRQYALGQTHKHLPEMQAVCSLDFPPVFNPIVADFYAGMVTTVPIQTRFLKKQPTARGLWEFLSDYYKDSRMISVAPFGGECILEKGFLDAGARAGSDRLEIFVCGHDDQAVLISRFDNLGKGSSGAAVQCMNLMCGFEETEGLCL